MKLYIGTSSWQHEEMKGIFYPKDLPVKDWLAYYIKNFSTVEINTSFYRLKLASAYKEWVKKAPNNFIFAAKLFRFITHIKRLKIDEESLPVLQHDLENLSALDGNLGPILIQLPPGAKYNRERLEIFLKNLLLLSRQIFKRPPLFAIEFRHESWLNEEIYSLLKKNGIAFCISDSPDWPTAKIMTTDWVYVRFHGRPILFESLYPEKDLEQWAEDLLKLKPKKLFIYFNNSTINPTANARTLIRIFKNLTKGINNGKIPV